MVKKTNSPFRTLPHGLEILYEDNELLAVHKPAGLLTVETATEQTRTVLAILTDYVKKGNRKSRKELLTVHRLDQWTSGVLIFAKTPLVKDTLQARWPEVQKTYLAVVHGQWTVKEGVIESYLAENVRHVVYTTPDPARGKLARTAYKVLKETPRFSLMEIDLLTGRKNQIRVHFADKGHPIVGDRKYGQKDDGFARLALHAQAIRFPHPARPEILTIHAIVPGFFRKLVGKFPTPPAPVRIDPTG